MESEVKRPKVFISYSWSDPEHIQEIISLSKRLSEDSGIEVILDKWSLREGHDRLAFMEQAVTDKTVSKVLMISDSGYAAKADGKKGGVGTESQIISPKLYGQTVQSKFIPIAWERDSNGDFTLPTFIRHLFPIDFSTPQSRFENYEQLVRSIYDRPLHTKPAIGKVPVFAQDQSGKPAAPTGKFETFRNAITQDRESSAGLARDYLASFRSGLNQFSIRPEENISFDEIVWQSFEDYLPWRDQLIEYYLLSASFGQKAELTQITSDFLEQSLDFGHPPEGLDSYSEAWFDNYGMMIYENFLYYAAALLQRGRFRELGYLLSRPYLNPRAVRGFGNKPLGNFDQFYSNPGILEDRKRRLNLNRVSLMADLLRKRSTHHEVTFSYLMEIDLILYLKSVISEARWYPQTLLYLGNRESLPFFMKCAGTQGISNLCQALGVQSQEALMEKLESASSANHRWESLNLGHGYGYNLKKTLLVEKWGAEHFPVLS